MVFAAKGKPAGIQIQEVRHSYEDYLYRTPIKFGGTALDRVTLLNVDVVIRDQSGRSSKGFGSMPLGNIWAFPSKVMSYDVTLGAMKSLAERIGKITAACKESGHPVDLNVLLEPEYLKAAEEVSKEHKLAAPIPSWPRWSPPVLSTPPCTTPSASCTA